TVSPLVPGKIAQTQPRLGSEVPAGDVLDSKAELSNDGQVDVTLPKSESGKGEANNRGDHSGNSRRLADERRAVRKSSPFIGADGQWKLPPGAPPPAIAPFDAKKAKEHQEAWAKYRGVLVEITNSIGMKLLLIPPGE